MFKAPDAEPFELTKVQFWLMYSGEGLGGGLVQWVWVAMNAGRHMLVQQG